MCCSTFTTRLLSLFFFLSLSAGTAYASRCEDIFEGVNPDRHAIAKTKMNAPLVDMAWLIIASNKPNAQDAQIGYQIELEPSKIQATIQAVVKLGASFQLVQDHIVIHSNLETLFRVLSLPTISQARLWSFRLSSGVQVRFSSENTRQSFNLEELNYVATLVVNSYMEWAKDPAELTHPALRLAEQSDYAFAIKISEHEVNSGQVDVMAHLSGEKTTQLIEKYRPILREKLKGSSESNPMFRHPGATDSPRDNPWKDTAHIGPFNKKLTTHWRRFGPQIEVEADLLDLDSY